MGDLIVWIVVEVVEYMLPRFYTDPTMICLNYNEIA